MAEDIKESRIEHINLGLHPFPTELKKARTFTAGMTETSIWICNSLLVRTPSLK